MNIDNYEVDCRCANCDWCGSIAVPKGQLKPASCLCPNCGCQTAIPSTRDWRDGTVWPRIPKRQSPPRPGDDDSKWNKPYIMEGDPNKPFDNRPTITFRDFMGKYCAAK